MNSSLSFGSESNSVLHGNILVNIRLGRNFYEYRFDPASDSFKKTHEKEITVHEIDSLKYYTAESDSFREARKRLKKDNSRLLESATDLFNRDEQLSINRSYISASLGKCQANSVYPIKPLNDPRVREAALASIRDQRIIRNVQLTYAIITTKYDFGGTFIIVNILTKEVITPFCQEHMAARLIEWSPNGNFIAYLLGKFAGDRRSALVIYDVVRRQSILHVDIEDRVESTAWSPQSDAISILTEKSEMSYHPLNCCCLMPAGHPEANYTFSLRIFDFTREVKTVPNFMKKNFTQPGVQSILWE